MALIIPSGSLGTVDDWRQPTIANLRVRRSWPWGYSIQKFVDRGEPRPRASRRLLMASDYGGEHPEATHNVYCYLVVREGGSQWSSAVRALRRELLPDGRTMSYKRLDDGRRQAALVPFLKAAADLDGHVVAIAVDKRQKRLSTGLGDAAELCAMLGLTLSWKAHALEAMLRKVQFAALLLPLWSTSWTNVTWITDRDEFVQNDARHDDALVAFGRMMSFYISHPMGEIRMHTTQQDPGMLQFEDLCSIPDLAAGMLSAVSARMAIERISGVWNSELTKARLHPKDEVLADWFWDQSTRLRKTMIAIDALDDKRSVTRLMSARIGDDVDAGF